MVSGWDRKPPDHEPDISGVGLLLVLVIVAAGLLATFGWIFL